MQRPYTSAAPYTHAYNHGWSPPTQSNESTNGYFLERSNSAKKTLERAFELCPEEEQEVEEPSEERGEEDVDEAEAEALQKIQFFQMKSQMKPLRSAKSIET